MEQNAIERAKSWASNPYFEESARKEVQDLIDKQEGKDITERFYKDIEFGTGGLRSIIGMGTNRINKYTIRKATQAFSTELIKVFKNDIKVAISYDSRKYSLEFAKEAAGVFAGNNIKTYIFKELNPVPLLSYSVRHHKAQAGVMITASHNPPEYNGYKAYWDDGAQVTPPNDKNIIAAYNSIKDFSEINLISFEEGLEKNLIEWTKDSVLDSYYKDILGKMVNLELCKERGTDLKIIYTPIHGTGGVPCTRILKEMGLSNYLMVPEQAEPDEKFPTVSSPNPENPEAMKMAVDLMKKENADITFGTDPDTDRLGVAVFKNGEVFYPNGNQIGQIGRASCRKECQY